MIFALLSVKVRNGATPVLVILVPVAAFRLMSAGFAR